MLTRNHKTTRRTYGSVAALVTTVISVAVALVLIVNRQAIIDQVNVWQYHPTTHVQTLASRASFNDTGKFYFFASRPAVDDRQTFRSDCPNPDNSNTAVLGCYTGQRIYIYDVTNAQLDGIQAVTAAHETLHAAYDRLSSSERTRVNKLVEAEYNKLKDDKTLAAQMAFYAKTEPGERDNELHSVIGTEVAKLDPALENYYKKYFTDRQKVVALHDSYQAVFDQLQARADEINKQMSILSTTIKQDSDQYNTDVSQLNADIREFNDRAHNKGFSSQSQFDQERAKLTARVAQLNAFRAQINNDIATFNKLQSELANIASQSEQLNRSINSSLAPAPSL